MEEVEGLYFGKPYPKLRLMSVLLLAIFSIMVFASLSFAADARQGAAAITQARRAVSAQTAASAGAAGPGSDLQAITGNRQQPQTFTGFPAGTLPGGAAGNVEVETTPAERVAMSGDPLAPIIGPGMIGSKLDRICVVASHVGYTVTRLSYSPTVLDTPYTFALMHGNRRVSRLYFNHSMTLVMVD